MYDFIIIVDYLREAIESWRNCVKNKVYLSHNLLMSNKAVKNCIESVVLKQPRTQFETAGDLVIYTSTEWLLLYNRYRRFVSSGTAVIDFAVGLCEHDL